jgi:hypothetical protein
MTDQKAREAAARPAEVAAEGPTRRRPSDDLLTLQLQGCLPSGHLGIDLQRKVEGACGDLYDRFKVKDTAEALQVSTIVALHSAVLEAYGEAARGGRDRQQILVLAFQGTVKLVQLIDAFEARRNRKRREDPELRARFLQKVLNRRREEV